MRWERAVLTIEVDVRYGISVLYICEALAEIDDERGRHIAFDAYQSRRFGDCVLQFLAEAGVPSMVEYHAGFFY